jgi:hypothetical protein
MKTLSLMSKRIMYDSSSFLYNTPGSRESLQNEWTITKANGWWKMAGSHEKVAEIGMAIMKKNSIKTSNT